MKYVKMLGLLAVAAAALMAFAGTASATNVTSNEGETPTIKATAGETTLHGVSTITCQKSTVEGKVETHGAGVPASGKITHLAFEECNNPVTVISLGSLSVHTDDPKKANGNGIVTSSGARVLIHITGLGITCTFGTTEEATTLGTLKGGSPATLTISATIKRESGHSGAFCGSSGLWTGTYTVNTPSTLTVH